MKKIIPALIIISSLLAIAKLALPLLTPAGLPGNLPDLSQPRLQRAGKITVPVLIYHHIRQNRPADPNSVSPEIFAAQMKWLKENNYRVISYAEFYNYLASSSPPPAKSVVLSFDDGLKDQYLNALPILKKYGYPAIFFINYSAINNWWRWDAMNWPMVKDLLASGMEIGSHGLNHKNLTKLNPARAIYEIRQSKLKLEYKLMSPVNYFAYPYGAYSPDLILWTRQAGFWSAATDTGGAAHDRANGAYQISRISIDNDLESFKKIVQNK